MWLLEGGGGGFLLHIFIFLYKKTRLKKNILSDQSGNWSVLRVVLFYAGLDEPWIRFLWSMPFTLCFLFKWTCCVLGLKKNTHPKTDSRWHHVNLICLGVNSGVIGTVFQTWHINYFSNISQMREKPSTWVYCPSFDIFLLKITLLYPSKVICIIPVVERENPWKGNLAETIQTDAQQSRDNFEQYLKKNLH